MIKNFTDKIKGDKIIWIVVSILAIFSFLPIYSASSNFGNGMILSSLLKHVSIVFVGFLIMFFTHMIPYKYFKGLSVIGIPIIIVVLVFTSMQGTIIEGANASRWLKLPLIGLSFQPSSLATVIIMVYTAFYLSKNQNKNIKFKYSILPLWFPLSIIVLLILPSNLSTSVMIFIMTITLIFIGRYPIKYLFGIFSSGIFVFCLFIFLVKSYPNLFPNRVDTWSNRIENFFDPSKEESNYQIQRAKSAIANGSLFGVGAGKSTMKNILPQSTSDFIFAIITEEYGIIGAGIILFLYTLLLFRIIVVSYKSVTDFGQLLALGVGLPIIFQAYINMGVAVHLIPVTGQPLPLISSGGTSIWMTFLAIGIVLSVSVNDREDLISSENPLNILGEEV